MGGKKTKKERRYVPGHDFDVSLVNAKRPRQLVQLRTLQKFHRRKTARKSLCSIEFKLSSVHREGADCQEISYCPSVDSSSSKVEVSSQFSTRNAPQSTTATEEKRRSHKHDKRLRTISKEQTADFRGFFNCRQSNRTVSNGSTLTVVGDGSVEVRRRRFVYNNKNNNLHSHNQDAIKKGVSFLANSAAANI